MYDDDNNNNNNNNNGNFICVFECTICKSRRVLSSQKLATPSAPGSWFDLGPRDSKQTLCEDNNNNNKHPITNPPGYKPIEMSSIYYDILKPNEKPVNAKHI